MIIQKKTMKWIAYGTGVILLLMMGMAFLVPKLINTAVMREKIIRDLSRKIAGTVTFQSLDISLFPVPRLVIEQAGIVLPKKMEATMAMLKVYPQIIPLLRGEVKISKVQAQDPAITVYVSDRKESKPLSVDEISAAVRALVSDSTGLTVIVENGSLTLEKSGLAPASLQQVDARIVVDNKKDSLTVTLDTLKIASPRIMLSGILAIHPTSPHISLDIRGKGLEVGPLRDFALSAAQEVQSVRNVFDIVRDGNVPAITIHSEGDSFEALGATMNIEIKGEIEGGNIHIRGPGLDFTAVKGQYVISKGILQGTDITGRYGNSHLQQASLKLGVKGDDAPFHLDTLVKADLKEVLALLRRLVKDKTFSDNISLVQSLSGTAQGRLVLGESIASLDTRVMVSDMNFSAQYQPIPFPVTIKGGAFTYDEKQVSVKDLTGTMGQTTFSGIAALMDQGKRPRLAVLSGKMRIHAAEIYGWLSSFEQLRSSMKDITAVSGTITLSTVALQGPVTVPKEWRFKTSGTAENLVISTSSLPDSLTLRKGKFTIAPRQIVLEGIQAEMLDTEATVSGTLKVSSEDLMGSDISLDAETGPRGMEWIKTVVGLPPVLRVQQGLSLARGRINTSENEDFSFQGTITTKSGQTLGLDLVREKKELKITKLDIADAVSRASATLSLRGKSFDVTFSGRLDSSTLAALMELEQMPAGHLAGDFTAHVLKDQPEGSTAKGRLTGEKILLPWKPGMPLYIDGLSVSAEGSRITVLSSRLRLADIALLSSGTLTFGKDGLDVNMEVEADRLEWKSLEKIMEDEEPAEQAAGRGTVSGMPVIGTAKITAHEFVYDKFTISPLQADISFSPGQAAVQITKASPCGISVQGRIDLAGREQTMDVTLDARDEDLGPTMACLSDRDADMTGRFSLDGKATLALKATPLLKGLEGTLSFLARDGRINKSVPLSKIFSLLSVTEYFRGLPDLRKEGFSYSTVTIRGDIHQGMLSLKEAIIDGSTMEIVAEGTTDLNDRKADITVLVAPFKNLDSMFRILPGRNKDKSAPLVSMGVRVTGDFKNPDVSVQPLSGISRGLSGAMERILKAPLRIIEPFIPQEKE